MQVETPLAAPSSTRHERSNVIILRDQDASSGLPIWVGAAEANARSPQLRRLLRSSSFVGRRGWWSVEILDSAVDKVVVCDLTDNTFYALIHLTVRGEPVAIDARPSDAIALALRARAPIFVEEAVIEHARTTEAVPERATAQRLQKWLESLDSDDLGKYKM
jgi:bifunctional DNase/RNase